MSVLKATSWGRTRRPKHMVEDAPVSKQTATTVTTVAVGSLSDDLTGTNSGENGYVTENQRFLHLQIENDDTSETIKIYGYNYAGFGLKSNSLGVKNGSDTTAELGPCGSRV